MNSVRFISVSLHRILDYVGAFALITAPWILNFQATSPLALWLSVASGVLLLVYSLMTDYRSRLVKSIPFRTHLVLDTLAALAFLIAPFLFGFEGLIRWFYLFNGAVVLLIVLVTDPGLWSEGAS